MLFGAADGLVLQRVSGSITGAQFRESMERIFALAARLPRATSATPPYSAVPHDAGEFSPVHADPSSFRADDV